MGNNSINDIDNLMQSSKGGSQYLSSTVVSDKIAKQRNGNVKNAI
jgi:hypothetical protein